MINAWITNPAIEVLPPDAEEGNPVACEWSEDEYGVVWTSCGIGYDDMPAVSTCPSCSGRVVFIPSVELEAMDDE